MNSSLRFRVLSRDKFTCRYCGAKAPDVKLQVDHVIPVSLGGLTTIRNLVSACFACNNGKRAILMDADLIALIQPQDEPADIAPVGERIKRREPRPIIPRRPFKRVQRKPLPVSLGAPYIAADQPAQEWLCSVCGMHNELERQRCSCDEPVKPRYYCRDCNEPLDGYEEGEFNGRCEPCHEEWYFETCQECGENPRARIDGELDDWCVECIAYERQMQEAADATH